MMLDDAELREQPEPEGAEEVEETGPIPKKLKAILAIEGNLLDFINDDPDLDLTSILERVETGFQSDKESMKDYIEKQDKLTKLASMKADEGDKTFPFQGASKIMMQHLAQAAIDFNSRTVPEVVNRKDIANVDMWGGEDEEKCYRAERVASATNWWLKKGIKGWSRMKDRGLLLQPVNGMYFNKIWWADHKINESLITAQCMIYDHDADSFELAPRKSHEFPVERNDYISLIREGQWEPIKQLEDENKDAKQPVIEKPLKMIESHCTLDLDQDGYSEPYIVTWSDEYDAIVRIERRFSEDDVECKDGQVIEIAGEEFFVQHGFIPSLEKAAVYDGWGTLLYSAFEQINTLYRQAIDANTLNITAMNSGFMSTSLKAPGRAKSGRVELIMGQFSRVDAGAGISLKDQIWTPPFNGMSQGFYQMLTDLKTEIMTYCAASQSVDVQAGQAASLYLAQLQQALKVPNAIMSRVYESLSKEFQRIYDLQKRYMDNETYLQIVDWHPHVPPSIQQQYQEARAQWEVIAYQAAMQGMAPPEPPKDPQAVAMSYVTKDKDFADSLQLITSADPTLGSREERLYRAEIVVNNATANPDIYNKYQAHRSMLKEIGIPNLDEVLPEPTNQPDPMMEAQIRWTHADAARMESEVAVNKASAQEKMANAASKATKAQLDEEMGEAKIDNLNADTMNKLIGIDEKQANIEVKALDIATEHNRQDIEERKLYAQQAMQPVVSEHPEHGNITEDDIQTTMREHGMTRDQVLSALQQQEQV